jgi:preprotein translocase subunit SecA
MVIPTNVPVVRDDIDDRIYRTRREKFNAIVDEISAAYDAGRPTLVGTVSVETSETISRMLKRAGIEHNVLNAKQHQREAEIVARAGEASAVTIATNMAGRGTDIKLGDGVREAGGLHVIGTERHESRRIDRQLRGRAGRQGDPGSSLFFMSLEDDLMRLFGGERVATIMDKMGVQEGEVIAHKMVTSAIERAQKKVEAQNFAIRKHTLEYDDVMNVQRKWIYERRLSALERESIRDEVVELIEETVGNLIDSYCPEKTYPEEWNLQGFTDELRTIFLFNLQIKPEEVPALSRESLEEKVLKAVMTFYTQKEAAYGNDVMRQLERYAVLSTIDRHWRDHLAEIDELRTGIYLRAAAPGATTKPIDIYKKEAFTIFQTMVETVDKQIVNLVFKLQVRAAEKSRDERRREANIQTQHAESTNMALSSAAVQAPGGQAMERNPMAQASQAGKQDRTIKLDAPKVGRNDPCPCGSGKKYKKCHGQ